MRNTIVVSEDGMFTSNPMAITEMADIFCSAITAAVQQVQENFSEDPEADAPAINKELFDCLNISFSKCLENSFPEYELHPEITEEVLKMEDYIVAQRANNISAQQEN